MASLGPNEFINMANVRRQIWGILIVATGLVILTQIGFRSLIFQPCNLRIWWITLKSNRTTLLHNVKLCASFEIHRRIQIGVTVRKLSIWVKIGVFLSHVTFKFDGWSQKSWENNRAPPLYYVKLCASFQSHRWIQIGVTVRKRSIGVKTGDFLSCVTLNFVRWPRTRQIWGISKLPPA